MTAPADDTAPTLGKGIAEAFLALPLTRQHEMCALPTFVGALTRALAEIVGRHALTVQDSNRLMTGFLVDPTSPAGRDAPHPTYYATFMYADHIETMWSPSNTYADTSPPTLQEDLLDERRKLLAEELGQFDFGPLPIETAFTVIDDNPETARRHDGRLITALWWQHRLEASLGVEGAQTMLALRLGPDHGLYQP